MVSLSRVPRAIARRNIQLHRDIAPANLMHDFSGAWRIRQFALRLLTGADNHLINRQYPDPPPIVTCNPSSSIF